MHQQIHHACVDVIWLGTQLTMSAMLHVYALLSLLISHQHATGALPEHGVSDDSKRYMAQCLLNGTAREGQLGFHEGKLQCTSAKPIIQTQE